MLKETIKYTDFNGVEREEDFYFNLTKAEITEMEMSVDGGLVERINKIVQAKDAKEIVKIFKTIVLDAYGEKSADGRRFIKTPELREAFSQTMAYSNLFMELATNDVKAAAFIKGIMPKEATAIQPIK
jgi:hypothetical protein|nr:MAG TPA: hypothetical protein [Caudoviricetes sp.]